jgi:hypothetical protein
MHKVKQVYEAWKELQKVSYLFYMYMILQLVESFLNVISFVICIFTSLNIFFKPYFKPYFHAFKYIQKPYFCKLYHSI